MGIWETGNLMRMCAACGNGYVGDVFEEPVPQVSNPRFEAMHPLVQA